MPAKLSIRAIKLAIFIITSAHLSKCASNRAKSHAFLRYVRIQKAALLRGFFIISKRLQHFFL